MNPPPTPNPYKHPRFPVEMLGHGAWLYRTRLPQRRDGEELMAEGGVILTDEVVRYWCGTCGQADVHLSVAAPTAPGKELPEEEIWKMLTDVRSLSRGDLSKIAW
jgi:hypothetical protein